MANGANFSRIKCWGKIGVALIRPSGTGMYAGRLGTAGVEGGEGNPLAVTTKC
jgi:hypothetical protein